MGYLYLAKKWGLWVRVFTQEKPQDSHQGSMVGSSHFPTNCTKVNLGSEPCVLKSSGSNLVELKSSKLHSLVDVLHFLGLGVGLLLSLLATTAQSQNQVQGALLLDVVIRESSAVLELLATFFKRLEKMIN